MVQAALGAAASLRIVPDQSRPRRYPGWSCWRRSGNPPRHPVRLEYHVLFQPGIPLLDQLPLPPVHVEAVRMGAAAQNAAVIPGIRTFVKVRGASHN